MFIGHFGAAFAAKKAVPSVSLATLIFSAQWLDLLWPGLLLMNLEKVMIEPGNTKVTPLHFAYYPWSHSLLLVFGWALLIGVVHYIFMRNRRAATIIGLLVISHWILDLFMHRPDLPLYPGNSPLLGLGLWNSLTLTLILETFLFVSGVFLYLQVTRPKNKRGVYGFWTLVVLLYGIYLVNLFGPPPPDVISIAFAGHLQWLFVALGYWVDKNRKVFAPGIIKNNLH
jgi:hypothetical protein